MPTQNCDVVRKTQEVQELTSRLSALVAEVSPDADGSEELGENFEMDDMKKPSPVSEFEYSMARVAKLIATLNVEGREAQLEEVSDWLHHRAPTARRDMQVLGQLDKDCIRRESERVFLSLSTSDKLRKSQKGAPMHINTFRENLGSVHSERSSRSIRRHARSCDAKLTPMSDEEVKQAIVDLKADLALREKEALASVRRIEDEHQFIMSQEIPVVKDPDDDTDELLGMKKAELDVVGQQTKLMYYAKQSLREIESRNDLVVQAMDYLKSQELGVRDATTTSAQTVAQIKGLIEQKRQKVRDENHPKLLQQRNANHGTDVEMPSEDYLHRLKDECRDIQRRIDFANLVKGRLVTELSSEEALDQQLSDLRAGIFPRIELLDDCRDNLQPNRDYRGENLQEEKPGSVVAMEEEHVAQNESQAGQLVKRISDEQNALFDNLLRAGQTLKSQEAELARIEVKEQKTRETIELIEDHRALAAICLACARGTGFLHDGAVTPQARKKPKSKAPVWQDACNDIVAEFLGAPPVSASAQLHKHFHDSESGLPSAETLSFQSEVLKQLELEEKQLQKEVQELSNSAEQRLHLQRLSAIEGFVSPARITEISDAEFDAKVALEQLVMTSKSLLSQHWKTTGQALSEAQALQDQHEDYQARKDAVDSSKATRNVLGRPADHRLRRFWEDPLITAKDRFKMREVVALEAEHRQLARKLATLAPETEHCRNERVKLRLRKNITAFRTEDREYEKLLERNRTARQQARALEVKKLKALLAIDIKRMLQEQLQHEMEMEFERQNSADSA